MKLYLVILQGPFSFLSGCDSSKHYVVADGPSEAYEKVRDWMHNNNYGFIHSRQMKSVELIAVEDEFCGPFKLWL